MIPINASLYAIIAYNKNGAIHSIQNILVISLAIEKRKKKQERNPQSKCRSKTFQIGDGIFSITTFVNNI